MLSGVGTVVDVGDAVASPIEVGRAVGVPVAVASGASVAMVRGVADRTSEGLGVLVGTDVSVDVAVAVGGLIAVGGLVAVGEGVGDAVGTGEGEGVAVNVDVRVGAIGGEGVVVAAMMFLASTVCSTLAAMVARVSTRVSGVTVDSAARIEACIVASMSGAFSGEPPPQAVAAASTKNEIEAPIRRHEITNITHRVCQPALGRR